MAGAAKVLSLVFFASCACGLESALAQGLVGEGGCRDGQVHGPYQLRASSGQVRVVGAFNRGRRSGSFLFWSSDGRRYAQLPYEDDVLAGTVALWHEPAGRDAEPREKLEAAYVNGRLSGMKRSWHANGRLRTEFAYRDGDLVEARAFTVSGARLAEGDARAMAGRDLAADAIFLASLESLVRAHLPRCAPASDRLERG